MRICVSRSERNSYSETFIRDQISGLRKYAEVFPIHSGRLPERSEDGKLLASWLFWILHKIVRSITGIRDNWFGNFSLFQFLKRNRIDVVISNYGISAAHLVTVCKTLSIPLVVIFHGHDATDKKLLQQYKARYQKLFGYASWIVVVSNVMRSNILLLGAPAGKVQVIPCGVDITKFNRKMNSRERLFLAVGRFVPKKGPLQTLKAFHKVWLIHPDVQLIMIGAHKGQYEQCRNLVHSLGMGGVVSFPGVVQHSEVGSYMNRALAFVQHSVTAHNGDMEGTPVSIMEAGASGLPVVSTFHGGIPDAVVHGKTGFLVKEEDVDAMAGYMLHLLDDPALAERMGLEARIHIAEHYNQSKQTLKLFQLAVEAKSVNTISSFHE